MRVLSRWLEPAGGLGLFEGVDEIRERPVVDPAPALGRGDGQTDRQMCLADAGRAEEHDVLLALQEAELVKRVDLLPLDRGLEAEVEVRERLDRRKTARSHGGGEAPAVAQRDLGGQEPLDGFCRGGSAAVHAGKHLVEGFQGAGHLQIGELGRDARAPGPGLHEISPVIPAYSDSGRRSTSTTWSAEGTRVCVVWSSGNGVTGR